MMTGAQVWNRLRAEGGFVHTMADGRQFVRFNRGHHPSAELVKLLKSHREELKAFIIKRHAEDDHLGWSADGVGTPGGSRRPAPNGRGREACDCNAAARLPISGKSADFGPVRHRRAKFDAISVVAALLASFLAAFGEISGASALPVDLRCVLSTDFPLGEGRACAWCPGVGKQEDNHEEDSSKAQG